MERSLLACWGRMLREGLLGPFGLNGPTFSSENMVTPATINGITASQDFVPGRGKSMQSLNESVFDIAGADIPVLILGESGTGKEVYARLLHRVSRYSALHFKKINCSAPDRAQSLRQFEESSRKGTDAERIGTLFLDGLDELDLDCQSLVLSLLSSNETRRESIDGSIRLIVSTSRELDADVKRGNFRKELYYRVNGVCLRLPPLRERIEDIGELFEHFLQKHERELGKAVPRLNLATMDTLLAYDWPGNIRELENLARKIVVLGNFALAMSDIRPSELSQKTFHKFDESSSLKAAAKAASREKERELILSALERTKWNRKRAALELRISYKALLYKLKQIESRE